MGIVSGLESGLWGYSHLRFRTIFPIMISVVSLSLLNPVSDSSLRVKVP